MHFCPRDTCQTAWHRECLSTHRIRRRPACADRKLSLLCSIPIEFLKSSASPDPSSSPPSLLSLLSKSNPASRSQSGTRKPKRAFEADALSLFEDIPSELTELASQPIIKPTLKPSDAYEEPPKRNKGKRKAPEEPENGIHNVAGNITMVLKARVLVNDILRGTTNLPRDWKKKVGWDGDTVSSIIVDGGEDGPCPSLLCPTCGEYI